MKVLLFTLLLFMSSLIADEYAGDFINISKPYSSIPFYQISVNSNGSTMLSYLWASSDNKGAKTAKNLATLVNESMYPNRVKVKTNPNRVLLELTVYSIQMQTEFFEIYEGAGINILRVCMGGDGAIVVKVAEGGSWRYHPNGSPVWPLFVPPSADNTSSPSFVAMRDLYYGDQDITGSTISFQVFLDNNVWRGYPISY